MLSKGDRIWVNVPKKGYVGVGTVTGDVVKARDFYVSHDGKELALPDLGSSAEYGKEGEDDDHAEYVVPIKWTQTHTLDKAFSETGFFGNQNSVCKPKAPKWQHTVERLKQVWGVD